MRVGGSGTLVREERGNASFWAWPDATAWRTFVWVAAAGAAWFVLIYGGADFVTSRRSLRVPIHLTAELRIPLVPSAVWVYMSMYGLFFMGPFVLRAPRELIALGAALAAVTTTAGVVFLLVPAELAFAEAALNLEPGTTARLYEFADWLNLRYNLLPSLHVALSVTCVASYAPRASRMGAMVLWGWALAIAASTVLTHFHHVVDAVAGFALGLAAARVGRAFRPAGSGGAGESAQPPR